MKLKDVLRWMAMALAFVGSLAWGVYGLTGWFTTPFNLVEALLGYKSFLANLVYVLVGASAVYLVSAGKK